MCGHTGRDFLAVGQLVVDLKRVFGIDEEVVEVQDALAKPLQVAVTRRGVPYVVGRNDFIQRRYVANGI